MGKSQKRDSHVRINWISNLTSLQSIEVPDGKQTMMTELKNAINQIDTYTSSNEVIFENTFYL